MTSNNRFGLPHLGYGVGLRSVHYDHVTSVWPKVDWFEILSENYLTSGGRPARVLDQVRERYPIVMHGVSLSIGSTDPLDFDHLKRLKALADRVDVAWMGDHVCWTGVAGRNSHDLWPIPYTEESLDHVVRRIRTAQEVLERPLILENASTYLTFTSSTLSEQEFLRRMTEESDCGLLLDVNNVYVSCFNHGLDAQEYLHGIPMDRVVQLHLAGHADKGTHLLDTHGAPVVEEVWKLYRQVQQLTGGKSTLVEWDTDIPEFSVVEAELAKAREASVAVGVGP